MEETAWLLISGTPLHVALHEMTTEKLLYLWSINNQDEIVRFNLPGDPSRIVYVRITNIDAIEVAK